MGSPDVLQKVDLALRERPVGGQHEQHQVSARHVLLRQPLLAAQDDVGAGRVHHVHLPQQLRGQVPHLHGLGLGFGTFVVTYGLCCTSTAHRHDPVMFTVLCTLTAASCAGHGTIRCLVSNTECGRQ